MLLKLTDLEEVSLDKLLFHVSKCFSFTADADNSKDGHYQLKENVSELKFCPQEVSAFNRILKKLNEQSK